MSLAVVRPYFRERAEALGFEEHKDAFNLTNVGASGLGKIYHVAIDGVSARNARALPLETNVDVVVRFFFGGKRDTQAAYDQAVGFADRYINECLKVANRLHAGAIKNVEFRSLSLEPLNPENDNVIVSSMGFTAYVLTDLD